jgi:pSer/pThr/pTyr-binding forkhead associated (FHA) protein
MNKTKISIGRAPGSDIHIDERWDTVSNQHADVELQGGQLVFIDHSTNGTIINGQKVQNTSVDIFPGDNIKLANAFDLEWEVISSFFPNIHRPTVTMNVRGQGNSDSSFGRRTVQMNAPQDASKHGRQTERFKTGDPATSGDTKQSPTKEEANYGQANEYSQSTIDKEVERWNWGAFFCSWLWAVCHGIYWPLLILLVAGIPYLGQVCSLCLSVYLGLTGSKTAWRKGRYSSFDKFKRAQRIWAICGVFCFALAIILGAVVLNRTLTLF